MASYMLQIAQNSAQQLVAVQTPGGTPPILLLEMVAALCIVAYTAFRKNWWLFRFFLALLVLLGLVMLLSSGGPAYRLQVDRVHGRVASVAMRKGAVVSSFDVPVRELSGAEMQFDRGASTVILIRNDGSLLYPLGEQHLQNEPDQYVVLVALRNLIAVSKPTAP